MMSNISCCMSQEVYERTMDNSTLVILNAIAYVVTFFYFLKKRGKDVGVLMLFVYAATAVFCAFYFFEAQYKYSNLYLWSFVYLYGVVVLFMRPFLIQKIKISHNPLDNYPFYRYVTYVFIIFSLFSLFFYIPDVIDTIQAGEWRDVYYANKEEQGTSFINKVANFTFHLRYLGMILFLSNLAKYPEKKLLNFLLGISAILPTVLVSIAHASRGNFVSMLLYFIVSLLLFKNIIPPRIQKKITIALMSFFLPIMAIYLISVTVSRFEYGDISAEDSVLMYLGHSMLTFNCGLVDTIDNYAYGAFMFRGDSLANVPDFDSFFGTHFGSAFFTFVGGLYLDFGPIGTVVIALLFPCLFIYKRNKNLDIPDILLLMVYVMYILDGVFVMGRGYGFEWIEAFVVAFLLKILQRSLYGKSRIVIS